MKIYKYLALATGLLLMVSCNDFIDKDPLSDFTTEGSNDTIVKSKYSNVSDAESELNGAYSKFKQDIFQLENYMIGDIQSDNCYLGADETAGEDIDLLKTTSINVKVSIDWGQYFGMSGTATNVIENTRLMEDGSITDSERNRIMSEAKFIRAFAYFDIVRLWGDAPMVLELIPTITNSNIERVYPLLYPPRTSAEKIYETIIDDLTSAIPYLDSSNKGEFKATKGAAYALLAKVYATHGAKASRDYNKVVEYCDDVLAEGYQLVDDYESLWLPDNKFTTESIFEILYTADAPNWAYWVLLKETDGSVTWRRYCTPTHELLAKYEKNDVRKTSSFIWRSVPYDVYYPAKNYPLAYKIREKSSNIILMRLADVILLKAEALVELNRVSEAVELTNQIRQRAGLTDLDKTISQSVARLAVEKERQLELVLEGQRWYDLVRNERMVNVMSQHKDGNGNLYIKKVDAFRTLWPIPQGQIDLNQSLTQNEGY